MSVLDHAVCLKCRLTFTQGRATEPCLGPNNNDHRWMVPVVALREALDGLDAADVEGGFQADFAAGIRSGLFTVRVALGLEGGQ